MNGNGFYGWNYRFDNRYKRRGYDGTVRVDMLLGQISVRCVELTCCLEPAT